MRLLTRAHDREDLEDLRSLLERKGIPVRLDESGVDTCLYVHLANQFQDARALLRNAEHEVRHPVDVAEFHATLANVGVTGLVRPALHALATVLTLLALIAWVLALDR